DGFDRQPEIVRDILPAHRQRDGLPLVADLGQTLPPADEEGRDLLLRGAPTQQQHLLLRQHQFLRRERVDPNQEMRPLFNEMREYLSGEAAYRHGVDGVRREAVAIGRRGAEKVTRQRETDHLTSPIRQQLVQTRDARGQAVHRTRDLARREQRLIGSEMTVAGDPLELRKVGLIKRAADAERPDGTGRAAAETCTIRRDRSYHCPCPVERRIDALSPGLGPCASTRRYNSL